MELFRNVFYAVDDYLTDHPRFAMVLITIMFIILALLASTDPTVVDYR